MSYADYRNHMEKTALVGELVTGAGDLLRSFSDLGAMGATYIVAASVLAGAGAGYGAAKLTSSGKQDEKIARKSYENERLKADLGYLSARVRQEYGQSLGDKGRRAARVLA